MLGSLASAISDSSKRGSFRGRRTRPSSAAAHETALAPRVADRELEFSEACIAMSS